MSSASTSSVPVSTVHRFRRDVDIDNLVRSRLNVGDPNDPVLVAQALTQIYTKEHELAVRESQGHARAPGGTIATLPVSAVTATSLDLKQAKDDLEMDFHAVQTSNQLKDVRPELEGWAQAIRAAVREGERAATLGMDTAQRDKTFAVRRTLSDYARAARLVAAFKPGTRDDFRSLAQSLDEVASVLLVMMGEAIASSGIAGGRYLLQVPFTELQARREAVVYALRNLMGTSQYAYGQNELPRGLNAYRALVNALEAHGQGDLRSLLAEPEITGVMDQLIDRAGQGVSGLRALASTAAIDIQRFQRLRAAIGWNLDGAAASPPLLAFQEALGLFVDGFRSSGGMRLMHIARPQILWYGLYGSGWAGCQGAPNALDRLDAMLRHRGNLASFLDANAECACDGPDVRRLAMMDHALGLMDRTIDLYSMGSDGHGEEPEHRASAFGHVLAAQADYIQAHLDDDAAQPAIAILTEQAANVTRPGADPALMVQEFEGLLHAEHNAVGIVRQMVGESSIARSFFGRLAGAAAGDIDTVMEHARIVAAPGMALRGLETDIPEVIDFSIRNLAGAAHEGIAIARAAAEAAEKERQCRRAERERNRECDEQQHKDPGSDGQQRKATGVEVRASDGPYGRLDILKLSLSASRRILEATPRGPVELPITPSGELHVPKDGKELWSYDSHKKAKQACDVLESIVAQLEGSLRTVRTEAPHP